jgi:hypothetical protein
MMRYRLVLLGLNAILLASIGWILMQPPPPAVPSRSGNRQPAIGSVAPPPATTAPLSSLDRSLFRSALPANAAAPPEAAAAQPQLRLVGVLFGERRIGFVEQTGAKLRRVTEGDEIEGWTVRAIDARALTLSRDDRTITYRLDPPRNS